jgi:hypothetical protein
MSFRRAMAPGPRTIAPLASLRSVGLALVVAAGLVGCGTSAPASPAATPAASAGAPSPDPSARRWPGGTALAMIALGAADAELQQAGADFAAAADKKDLKALWGAADGLAKLIDELMPEVGRLADDPDTRAAGVLYQKAFPQLGNGAKKLRDAITAGDSAGILAGTQEIVRGLADYAAVRQVIGPLVEQAFLQQRLLTK